MDAKADKITVEDLHEAVRQIKDRIDLIDRLLGNMDPKQDIPNLDPPIALKKDIHGGGARKCLIP